MLRNVSGAVGNTPLIQLNNFAAKQGVNAKIFGKYEGVNPTGSIKDRAALFMLDKAEQDGIISDGAVIIEPTSGNTGIGLAAIGAARGYKVILTMPDTMSSERISLLRAYGAEVVLTEGALGMDGAVRKANELAKTTKNSFIPSQFDNPANPLAHFNTTGPEIWRDTNGKLDIFVACIGTGGTLTGTGRYLKKQNPKIKVVGVEPFDSPLITKGKSGGHKIQGIGANFIPENFDKSIVDNVLTVTNEAAFAATSALAKSEGLLCGISSGAALCAAVELAKQSQNKNIVVILPDNGDRYMSLGLFE